MSKAFVKNIRVDFSQLQVVAGHFLFHNNITPKNLREKTRK